MNRRQSTTTCPQGAVKWAPTSEVRLALAALLSAATVISTSTDAQAQVPDAVYRDVKDVIEELMMDDVRRNVDTKLRCGSPDGIGRYYARSMDHLRDGLFGGLRATLQDETIDLTADYVFRSVVEGGGTPISLKTFFPVPWTNLSCTPQTAAVGPAFDDACKGIPKDSKTAMACALSLGVRATLRGNPDVAVEQAIAVIAELVAESAFPAGQRASVRPVIASYIRDALRGKGREFGFLTQRSLDEFRKKTATFQQDPMGVLSGALDEADLLPAAVYLTKALDGLTVVGTPLPRPGGPQTPTVLKMKDILRIARQGNGADAVGALVAALGFEGKRVQFARTGTKLEVKESSDPAAPPGDVAFAENMLQVLGRRDTLNAALGPFADALGVVPDRWATTYALAAAFSGIEKLQSVWTLEDARSATRIDLLKLLDAVLVDNWTLEDVCPMTAGATSNAGADACAALRLLRVKGTDLRRLAPAISRGDRQAIAAIVIRDAFEIVSARDCDSAGCRGAFGRFAVALASYALDGPGEGSSEGSRQGFKSAAIDLIRAEGDGGGLDRIGRFWRRPEAIPTLYPTFSLRASFSAGYGETNSYRTMASIEWPTFRVGIVNSQSFYFGVHISILDAAAPLAELALRSQGTKYENDGIWVMLPLLLQPRGSLVFGSPVLSNHLTLTASLSERTAAPFATGDHSTYVQWGGDRPADAKSFSARFFEGGVGVMYIP